LDLLNANKGDVTGRADYTSRDMYAESSRVYAAASGNRKASTLGRVDDMNKPACRRHVLIRCNHSSVAYAHDDLGACLESVLNFVRMVPPVLVVFPWENSAVC